MEVSTWHDIHMSMMVEVVEYLLAGESVPSKIFKALSVEEQSAVRDLEISRRSESTWREITLSILRTATQLSVGQDQMQVLDELVRSAQEVLRSDVAYISLNDTSSNVTNVLTTAGVITELFRNIRIPFGIGVLGTVAANRSAAWTSDHRNDPKVSHLPEVDQAVEAEGIRGILGTPLIINNEVIGTLMVGDRRPRNYTADDVVILDSLASLASVALETAQLIEDLSENISAVKTAQVRSEEQIKQLKALSETESELMAALAAGARTKDVEKVLKKRLECNVWFWRENEPYPAAKEETVEITDELRIFFQSLIDDSRSEGGIVSKGTYSALAVSVNQRYIGAICVDREVSDDDAQILSRASQSFATILVFRQAILDAESHQINDLLEKVLLGIAEDEDLARIRKMTGLNLKDSTNLSLLSVVAGGALPNSRTLGRLLGRNSIAFEHDRHLCAVVKSDAGLDLAISEVIQYAREQNLKLYFGAVPFQEVALNAMRAHKKATDLAKSMRAVKQGNRVATAATFGSFGLLLQAGPETIDSIIDETIGAIIRYDKQHRTELVDTAANYFDQSRSVAQTAKVMFVHENTVRQRIDRISELLGPGWNTSVGSFDIHLALRAWRIARFTAE